MSDCVCGNPEGTNEECERCMLIAETDLLRAELWRLVGRVSKADEKSILQVLAAKGQKDIEDGRYVSVEQQKLNDAIDRGDELRDRAKDER